MLSESKLHYCHMAACVAIAIHGSYSLQQATHINYSNLSVVIDRLIPPPPPPTLTVTVMIISCRLHALKLYSSYKVMQMWLWDPSIDILQ